MSDLLDIAMLYRPPRRDIRGRTIVGSERHCVDFLVNGISLSSATGAGRRDMWGCFSPDYATCGNELARNENKRRAKVFNFELPPDVEPDRVALFVCPQCGDLACGAITFQLSRDSDAVRWSCFAYENGYDEMETDFATYSTIGPFAFSIDAYMAVIRRAATAQPMVGR